MNPLPYFDPTANNNLVNSSLSVRAFDEYSWTDPLVVNDFAGENIDELSKKVILFDANTQFVTENVKIGNYIDIHNTTSNTTSTHTITKVYNGSTLRFIPEYDDNLNANTISVNYQELSAVGLIRLHKSTIDTRPKVESYVYSNHNNALGDSSSISIRRLDDFDWSGEVFYEDVLEEDFDTLDTVNILFDENALLEREYVVKGTILYLQNGINNSNTYHIVTKVYNTEMVKFIQPYPSVVAANNLICEVNN